MCIRDRVIYREHAPRRHEDHEVRMKTFGNSFFYLRILRGENLQRSPKLLRKSSGSMSSLLTCNGNKSSAFASSRLADGWTSLRVGTRPMDLRISDPSLDNTRSTNKLAALGFIGRAAKAMEIGAATIGLTATQSTGAPRVLRRSIRCA